MEVIMSGYGPLAARTTSAFPISIATSLALETLADGPNPTYDTTKQPAPKVDIRQYKELWVNLSTMFRNIIGSMPKDALMKLSPTELYRTLEFEIEVISSILAVECAGVCKPVFYYCDYKTPYTRRRHQSITLRQDTTDGQKLYTSRLLETMAMFFNMNRNGPHLKLDDSLKPISAVPAIVISHVPYDLLSYTNFQKLSLLESHTGILKDRNLWYTKYYAVPGEELNTLPFNRKLLSVFGDKVMYRPLDLRFRKMILEISRNRRWTPMTSIDKTTMDLELDLKEPYLVDMYKQL